MKIPLPMTTWLCVVVSLLVTLALETRALAAESKASGSALVYFGTYTGEKSKGIYSARLDLATGKLSHPELAAEAKSPSYLAIHPNRKYLYAVNEIGDFQGKKSGGVAAFRIEANSGKLALLNQQPSGGDGPCHVSVDQKGKAVFIANYGGGSIAAFPLQADGKLAPASTFIQHHGSSVNPQRQEGPHAHGIYVDPANRFVFVPDLGMDKIQIYRFIEAEVHLVPNEPPFASVPPGSGPRHFAFHPQKETAYSINEMLCTICAFHFNPNSGKLEHFQTVSTLPKGVSLDPKFSTAEIEVHPSGKFLYGSNRGHNSIAVFAIDAKGGELSLLQNISTGGKTPRGFGIDPTGQYLLAGNQDSDSVIVFRVDLETGRLTDTGEKISVGAPVCVTFLGP